MSGTETLKRHLRLFLASPQDVRPERDAVEAAVRDYNGRLAPPGIHLDVIRWETHAAPDWLRPQSVVERDTRFAETDIFVGIFWSRVGTPPGPRTPGAAEYVGGSVEEFYQAKALLDEGRVGAILLYFCTRPVQVQPTASPAQLRATFEQLDRLHAFRQELDTSPDRRGFYAEFQTTEAFKYDFVQHLTRTVTRLLERPPDAPAPREPRGIAAAVPAARARPRALPPLKNPAAAAAGFIWQHCDRDDQITDFRTELREARLETRPAPRAVVVYGSADEAHERFVEWLVRHEIEARRSGTADAAPVLRRPVFWPGPSDNARLLRGRLTQNLFDEFAPADYLGDQSAPAFFELPAVRASGVVAIEHQVDVLTWDAASVDLMKWYLNTFWKGAAPAGRAPLVLVFLCLRVDLAAIRAAGGAARTPDEVLGPIGATLKELCKSQRGCRRTLLDRLGPVKGVHVRNWLETHTLLNVLGYDEQNALVEWILGAERGAAAPECCMARVLDRLRELFGQSNLAIPMAS